MVAPVRYGHSIDMASPFIPRVFIVDDSRPIRERVAQLLQANAMVVVGQAGAPEKAIKGILATRPDVVVLDVQLKGGSGLQVMAAVRGLLDTSFIVFSHSSGPVYRQRYMREGAYRFLDKSDDLDQLAQVVAQAHRTTRRL